MKSLFKKSGEKVSLKLSHIVFFILIFVILSLILVSFYLYSHFKTGDFVYKEETGFIGEVKGVSLPISYLVKWQDENFSRESVFNLKKLSDLSDLEVMSILKKGEKGNYRFYPALIKKTGIIFEGINNTNDSIGLELIPITGGGNFNLVIGKKGCKPYFFCGKWGECQTDYNLYSLIKEEPVSEFQYRYCKDYSECMTDFIDSRECELNFSIKTKRAVLGDKKYLEVYNKDDILISRIQLINETNKELNIQILLDKTRYYPYCYDGVKNYDEDEIDCQYSGKSCSRCSSEVLSLRQNYSLMLITLIALTLLCFLFIIWYLFLWKKNKKEQKR